MQRGEWSLTSLIVDMEAILTSQQAEVRQRGLRLLDAALSHLPAHAASVSSTQQVDAMAAFFTQRMGDERCSTTQPNTTLHTQHGRSAADRLPPHVASLSSLDCVAA